jgi:hypothetical protein
MKIAIIDIIGIPYDGSTVFNQGLGGSESAVTYISRELDQLDFEVTVFNNCDLDHATPGQYDGVNYLPLSALNNDYDDDSMFQNNLGEWYRAGGLSYNSINTQCPRE